MSRLRVISGTAGGRHIATPDGTATRPTSDRVREAVFNALDSAGVVADARAVDLFAGSGALGIEALSRGAAHVHFVDVDAASVSVIEDNLDTLGFRDRATIVRASIPAAVDRLGGDVDLVLADPPYAFDAWPDLLDRLAGHAADDAWAVLESDRAIDVGARWEKMRERAYGGTVITYLSILDPQEIP